MQTTDPIRRRLMRCGLLPRVESVGGMPSRGFPIAGTDDTAEVCPGYTTSLAEVREVAMAFGQYKAHYLGEFLGEPPTADFLAGCHELDRAHNALEAHRLREQADARKAGA